MAWRARSKRYGKQHASNRSLTVDNSVRPFIRRWKRARPWTRALLCPCMTTLLWYATIIFDDQSIVHVSTLDCVCSGFDHRCFETKDRRQTMMIPVKILAIRERGMEHLVYQYWTTGTPILLQGYVTCEFKRMKSNQIKATAI